MKAPLYACLLVLPLGLGAQRTAEAPAIAEAGPHHRVAQGAITGRDATGHEGIVPPQVTELAQATNPLDSASNTQTRLGHWRFNDGTWKSESGGEPLESSGVQSVTSFDGNAGRFNDPSAVKLRYACVETAGHAAMDCQAGTIRLMYRPDWNSGIGAGPRNEAVLVQLGVKGQANYWALRINATGTKIEFVQFGNGAEHCSTRGDINWTNGTWHYLCLTYAAGASGRSHIYVDGAEVDDRTGNAPVYAVPDASTRNDGFRLGSDHTGQSQARGTFDELETFNYPMAAPIVLHGMEAGVTATVSSAPPTIALRWRTYPDRPMTVKRRPVGQTHWTTLASSYPGWSYTDTGVVVGARYEYSLVRENFPDSYTDRYIQVAIAAPPVHERGYALLLIDTTVAAHIASEVDQLTRDLVGDGWLVLKRDNAPRHHDWNWPANTNRIATVKSWVDQDYGMYGSNLKAILVIGHVVIPHAGSLMPDGHHRRPFPVDLYYGDVVRSAQWTDEGTWRSSANESGIDNNPHDGFFDPQVSNSLHFPSAIEIPVSRIDFARLPILTQTPPPGVPIVSEADLLRRYLTKDHRYRMNRLTFGDMLACFGETKLSTWPTWTSLRNGASWSGKLDVTTTYLDIFHETVGQRFQWGFEFGFGNYDRICTRSPGTHLWTSADVANPAKERWIGFYMLDGSYFGEWDGDTYQDLSANNLLRCLLSPPNSGLAAMWGSKVGDDVCLQSLGLGDSLGEAWVGFLNSLEPRDTSRWLLGTLHLSLLGDGTLRTQIVEPPDGLQQVAGTTATLTWLLASDPQTRYYVYRSTHGFDGPFTLLTPEPIAEGAFTDSAPPGGAKLYRVRACRLVTTGSGSFHHLSQAAFVTVN